ncbi:hypothetical protein K466DRAFT_534203, partial [Polyporus arcularius HHB13444]
MTTRPARPRRPERQPWSLERLLHERALALEHALDKSTHSSYSSALRSYLSFCDRQHFTIEPTEQTLSLYVIYECHHIEPRSVDSYLSGICSELEPFYPNVRKIRSSTLVSRTLRGGKRLYSQPVKRKRALTSDDIDLAFERLHCSTKYDDLLFLTQLLTGFYALMRLGELVWPDRHDLRSFTKVSRRTTVLLTTHSFEFTLRTHKSDRQFSGDSVLVHDDSLAGPRVVELFKTYLALRDSAFPCRAELWLRHDGSIPTRSWFIRQLRTMFLDDPLVCGHSMRAGGATALALAGVSGSLIQ